MPKPLSTTTDAELIADARSLARRVGELNEDMAVETEQLERIVHQNGLYRVQKRGYSWARELEALRGTLYIQSVLHIHLTKNLDLLKTELIQRNLAERSTIHRLIGE